MDRFPLGLGVAGIFAALMIVRELLTDFHGFVQGVHALAQIVYNVLTS